jgi:hypothetical protein
MVSEDSDELVSGLMVIHRLCDLRDVDKTLSGQVPTRRDDLHTTRERFEVVAFRRPERKPLKERDNRSQKVITTTHVVLAQVLLVVVVPPVHEHATDPEEALQVFEGGPASFPLRNDEPVEHLVAGSVASSPHAVSLSRESDREASFSVYKTDHPATKLDQPFLLIFRIARHVVTIVNVASHVTMSSAGFPGLPAFGQMHTAPSPMRGATNWLGHCTCPIEPCHLRTVIVTAAVYRGLVSRLRPKANLST